MDVAPAGDRRRPGSDRPRGGLHQPLPGAAAWRAGQGGGGRRGREDGLRQPRTGECKSEEDGGPPYVRLSHWQVVVL